MTVSLPPNMQPAMTLQVGAPTGGVAWSQDGTQIAAYSDYGRVVTLWKDDGTQVSILHRAVSYLGNSLSFLPNGKELVTPLSDDSAGRQADALTVWNLAGHAEARNVPGPAPERSVQYNRAVAFTISSNGEELAAITSALPGQPLTIYRTSDWTQRASIAIPSGDAALSVAFSPDGSLIAIGTVQGRVLLCDAHQQSPEPRIVVAFKEPPMMGVESLAFSPDSRLLATGGGLAIGETSGPDLAPLKVWHVADGTLASEFHGGFMPVREVSWGADGRTIAAAAGDRTLRLFDIQAGGTTDGSAASSETIQLTAPVTGARFSPDGQHIAAASGNSVLIFDLHR